MAELNVIELFPADNPDNIPSQLRKLADAMEKQEMFNEKVIVLIPVQGDHPIMFSWGKNCNAAADMFELELAKAFLVNNCVERLA